MDLIDAKTATAQKAALNQLDGSLSRVVKRLRRELVDLLANVEVNIDYPEYDGAETVTTKLMQTKTNKIMQELDELLQTEQQGKILRDGLETAIVGRPNVGKSSLLNCLLHENKAIVTDVPGTTRDVLDEYVNVRGVPLHLIDTAGIRKTDNQVEKIGVDRSKAALKKADLVLLVLNASEKLTAGDRELLAATQDSKRIILLNKTDLPELIELDQLDVPKATLIKTSAVAENGTRALEAALAKLFFEEGVTSTQLDVMVTNARQASLLEQARSALQTVLEGLKQGLPVDIVQIDLQRAWEFLGEITGDNYDDELMDQLFKKILYWKIKCFM